VIVSGHESEEIGLREDLRQRLHDTLAAAITSKPVVRDGHPQTRQVWTDVGNSILGSSFQLHRINVEYNRPSQNNSSINKAASTRYKKYCRGWLHTAKGRQISLNASGRL
jgi:hypothetical protein